MVDCHTIRLHFPNTAFYAGAALVSLTRAFLLPRSGRTREEIAVWASGDCGWTLNAPVVSARLTVDGQTNRTAIINASGGGPSQLSDMLVD